jgi:hypothetical protein
MGPDWGASLILITHLVECLQEQDIHGATSIDKDTIEPDILDDGADDERIPHRLCSKIRVVTTIEGDGDLVPLKVFRGGGRDCHDLLGYEFLLPLRLIGVGSTVDVVDLLMSFGEIALWFFGLLLLIDLLDHLECHICKTLESIIILSLVLPLGVENVDPI